MFVRVPVLSRFFSVLIGVVGLLVVPGAARGTTVTVFGSLSGTYPVSAQATFVTSGSMLTLTLQNTSTATPTEYPAQVLTSFYFDLGSGTNRPQLTYVSGSGDVYRIFGGGTAAAPYRYTPPTTSGTAFSPLGSAAPSDIKSSNPGDNSWYFRDDLDATLPPFTKFGIGTVGNSGSPPVGLSPNNFPATYVGSQGQIDFGIFTGTLASPRGNLANLAPDLYLVKDSATFTFRADRDISTIEIADPFVFGFGTAPDQRITLAPEPGAMPLLAGGVVVAGGIWRRRRRPRRECSRV